MFVHYFLKGAIALALLTSNTITSLIDFFTFAVWIFYVLAMVVVLILRKTMPNANRPYKVTILIMNNLGNLQQFNVLEIEKHTIQVPLVVPIVVAIIGCYLVVAPIITDPAIEYLYTVGALLIGFVVYIPFVYYKLSFPCMGTITS